MFFVADTLATSIYLLYLYIYLYYTILFKDLSPVNKEVAQGSTPKRFRSYQFMKNKRPNINNIAFNTNTNILNIFSNLDKRNLQDCRRKTFLDHKKTISSVVLSKTSINNNLPHIYILLS